jgi:Rrf2 family transcriptional regulator, nitric oxide-sensitive transcriptional repressor
MRLSLQTDYALRTLLFLATRTGRTTVSDVAEFFGISAHHLGKVVHHLGRLGYVRNRRGPDAGIDHGTELGQFRRADGLRNHEKHEITRERIAEPARSRRTGRSGH